jgi:nicotinamide-nucleotide amidase
MATVSESDVEAAVAPLYTTFTNPRTTILSAPGQVELHLTAEADSLEAAEARIEELASGMRSLLPSRVYSEDGSELPQVVARKLLERGWRVSVAESCTGGLLATRLTDFPGSSAYLDRAYVTYANAAKVEVLGIDPALIEAEGAVSEPVAVAMAASARERARADVGIGITGIAGPGGGTAEKPVGLVFIALAGAAGDRVRRFHFPGERERVRFQATQAALEMLRRGMLDLPPL